MELFLTLGHILSLCLAIYFLTKFFNKHKVKYSSDLDFSDIVKRKYLK